jgi:hypothetical protein
MSRKAAKQLSLQRDLARACDPVLFARDCGLSPDAVQAELLSSTSRRVIVNCCRQWGKSSITALIALWECLYAAPARVCCISPSQKQSAELLLKVNHFWSKLPGAPHASQESASRMEFAGTGSRILSLPGSEKTVRGYSASLVILDECSRVSDELVVACAPMLAASKNGRLICLSTPAGKRGYFYEQWEHGENWHRIRVEASECSRISQEYLKEKRAEMGELKYEMEFCCRFHDSDSSVFSSALLEAALTDEFEPFLAD